MNIDSVSLKDFSKKFLKLEFKDQELLQRALTHKSYADEHKKGHYHYEKLELLGDALLDFLLLELLMETYPEAQEGELSKKRSSLVNKFVLSQIAKELNIQKYILMSRSEIKTKGYEKASILSAVVEAVIGAIYLDQGIDCTRKIIQSWYRNKIKDEYLFFLDFKTLLQEYIQGVKKKTPYYRLLRLSSLKKNGIQKQKFEVGVFVEKDCLGKGIGFSKKEAEQMAAQKALIKLGLRR